MSKQQKDNETNYRENHRIYRKNIILLVSLLSVITLSVGTMLAYIFTHTEDIINTFSPVQVSCDVIEEFDRTKKENVKIKNTGDTDAYIRAAIVVTWVDDDNNVYAEKPVEDSDYIITFSDKLDENWLFDNKNGFYYCKAPIAPGGETPQLISECSRVADSIAPEGYHLSVEIIASAIQSSPASVVEEQWGVTVANGNITGILNV